MTGIKGESINLSKVEFFFQSFSEIISSSRSNISTPSLHSQFSHKPCGGGLLDFKLGPLDNSSCISCLKNFKECSGHFGFLKLFLPVFNIGYLKAIHGILQIICKNCSRILLKEGKVYQNIQILVQKLKKKDKLSRIKSISFIVEFCKHQKFCPHCNSRNGKIRKIGNWNFIHELEFNNINEHKHQKYSSFLSFKPQGIDNILDPLKVFLMFQKIDRKDFELLDFDPSGTTLENLMFCILPIPPLVVRPTVSISIGVTNEDDLTIRLVEIQTLNLKIKKLFFSANEIENLWEIWSILQIECALYLNSEIFTSEVDNKNLTGIYQRLKGKNGRFRGSLGGKRVDFSGRTVISPDPNIGLNLIGLPITLALKLTFPEKLTKFNHERLKRCLIRGSNFYPGANCLIGDNWKKNILHNIDSKIPTDLKEGNVLERHIKDHDIILFNRQPSLHRISIMAHRVRVMTGKTFRLNECVCKPYNADFDGDEMNIHIPQSQKARAEAISLMNPIKNFKTPRNGEPMIASTQDFLTFSYILTSKNIFFSYSDILKIIGIIQIETWKETLPPPTIIKPLVLWTGKQIFSRIFLSIKSVIDSESKKIKSLERIPASYSFEEKTYSLNVKQCSPFMCPFDGWVTIQNNELLGGRIGKTSIGSGNKNSILSVIENYFSDFSLALSLLNMSQLTYEWFSDFGFTICLDDMIPNFKKKKRKFFFIKSLINLNCALKFYIPFESQVLLNLNEREEIKLNGIIKKIREKIAGNCLDKEQYNMNPIQLMFLAGSKGSLLNFTQMTFFLGQQTLDGKRINGNCFISKITNKKKRVFENSIIHCGFVKRSFYQGLDNLEFFFHAMAGREGLVDTAVKTSETGYIQRKLSKTMEDLVVFYDSTVRTSCGRLIQFNYGEDGIDPEKASKFTQITNLDPQNFQIMNNRKFFESAYFEIEIFVKAHTLTFINSSFFNNSFRIRFLKLGRNLNIFRKTSFDKIEIFLSLRKITLNQVFIQPGTSIGALAAQSIGEPCTQMTLQTFHSAGTGSVNITLGVPRINEILSVSKTSQNSKIIITHPSFTHKIKFMKLKLWLQKLKMKIIIEKISVSFQNCHIFTFIKFKKDILFLTGISDAYNLICNKLKKQKNLWKNSTFFLNRKFGEIRINWFTQIERKKDFILTAYKLFNFYKIELKEIVFNGKFEPKDLNFLPGKQQVKILISGEDFEGIITMPFLDSSTVYCNCIHKINQVLGIEATRVVIIKEIEKTFCSNNIFTDLRHLTILSDVITHQGELIGITRHGLPKIKSNTLALASFEKTVENLFLAASYYSRDLLLGVSENIILGKDSPVGTGIITLRNFL